MPQKTKTVRQDSPPTSWLHDCRTDCLSALVQIRTGDYLELVKDAHEQRGGIAGQRDVLKTTTAKRIRDRMISDIQAGAVLPPVVIGVVVDDPTAKVLEGGKHDQDALLQCIAGQELSIIDGMQRTASLIEAGTADSTVFDRDMRVEFWIAKSVRALIYRMLVLNTGQVPWTLARQLSVVYAPLLHEIKLHVKNLDKVFTPDKPGRRVGSGQFSSDSLVELYLAFSLRKTNVDPRESLSEEFSRLDFVQNLSDEAFQDHFYKILSLLVDLDLAFERYEGQRTGRFSRGKDVFGSQPARIGFIVAVALHVVGRPGLDRSLTDRNARMKAITKQVGILKARLAKLSADKVGDFLRLDILSEVLDKKVGQVGRYERGVFSDAFRVLLEEEFAIPNMEPCWRAN